MLHELKTLPKYFKAVKEGDKTFEVRKDDRNFQIGDTLKLDEWSKETGYTDEYLIKTVTYILGRKEDEKQFVAEGYVVLGMN